MRKSLRTNKENSRTFNYYTNINEGMLNNQAEANSVNDIFPIYVKNNTNNSISTTQPYSLKLFSIPYSSLQLANLIFLFGTLEKTDNNLKNIKLSLQHIIMFISERYLKSNKEKDIPSLLDFGQVA